MQKVRWGILSTGRIAHALARAIQGVANAELVAVGSRSQESADSFGAHYNIPHRHATYEALANNPDVDIIYIATPHSHHYENLKLCLNAGKHVLCEKAFTINAHQAQEMADLAREKGLFLMEAMWTRFIPSIVQARQWIQEGVIGDIKRVYADLSAQLEYNLEGRIYNPLLGGGALLDVGVYPVSFSQMLLGTPERIQSEMYRAETGVDELNAMLFSYPSRGAVAHLSAGVRFNGTKEATILGDKGYIRFHAPFHHSPRLTLQLNHASPTTHEFPVRINGYEYEVEECNACILAGKQESDIMPLKDTITVMQLMDTLRQTWGIRYPSPLE